MRSLTHGGWSFAPGLLPSIAGLLLVVLFSSLGIWQLRRADEMRARQAATAAQGRLPPIDLNRAAAAADDLRALSWRPATARGEWDPRRQVLLDNQISDGHVGYLVFTPLRLDACTCAVLVNRGWIEAPAERSTLPEIGLPRRMVALRGVLAPVPASGVGVRATIEPLRGAGLLRVQQLDLAVLSAEFNVSLLPLVLRLDSAAPDGYRRRWRQPDVRAERHMAYAVQWFAFALLTVGLYVGLNLRRRDFPVVRRRTE